MNVKAPVWGALFGALLGISWLIWDWRFLWVVVPVVLGYFGGRFLESRGEIAAKLKELMRVMFR